MIGEGCHKISSDAYHADPCPEPSMSRGTVIDLLNVPAKAFYNHPRLNPQPKEEKDESKFDPGSAWHDLLFEGGKKVYIVLGFDDWKKKDAQEARKAAREAGRIPLLEKQFVLASAMVESAVKQIRECEELGIKSLANEGKAEMTYIFNDGGTWERCLVDWISNDGSLIIDGKSTKVSSEPGRFSRHISDMQYQIQYAWYRRVVQGVTGKWPKFAWIAQEEEPPYLCSFNSIDPMYADMAEQQVEYAVKLWRSCMESGKWPGYTNRICYAGVKPWALAEWEEKKAALNEWLEIPEPTVDEQLDAAGL